MRRTADEKAPQVNNAVDAYHELLGDSELAEASVARLVEGQHERGLYFGEYALSVSLRPRLVSPERFDLAGLLRARGAREPMLEGFLDRH